MRELKILKGISEKILHSALKRKKRIEMKKGYRSCGSINLSIANMCINADNESLSAYEEKLAECENK